jgi:hypothetical protein
LLQHAGPKTGCCCAGRCRLGAVHGDGRRRGDRRLPLGAAGQALRCAAAGASAAALGRAPGAAPGGHRRGAADLWRPPGARHPAPPGRGGGPSAASPNHKRVRRVLKVHGLLLARHAGGPDLPARSAVVPSPPLTDGTMKSGRAASPQAHPRTGLIAGSRTSAHG